MTNRYFQAIATIVDLRTKDAPWSYHNDTVDILLTLSIYESNQLQTSVNWSCCIQEEIEPILFHCLTPITCFLVLVSSQRMHKEFLEAFP